jgi:tetratricopeptide (TPR) repeat protein
LHNVGLDTYLGACFKRLGRLEEAAREFEVARELSPNDATILFNLGLVRQEQGQWEAAISLYRTASSLSSSSYISINHQQLSEEAREHSQLRECDLLQAQRRFHEALQCWERAVKLFPNSANMHNELGNILGTVGFLDCDILIYKISQFLILMYVSYIYTAWLFGKCTGAFSHGFIIG